MSLEPLSHRVEIRAEKIDNSVLERNTSKGGDELVAS